MMKFTASALLLLASSPPIEGFSVINTHSNGIRLASLSTAPTSLFAPSTKNTFVLKASDSDNEEAEEVAAELTDDEPKEPSGDSEEEAETEEDDELEAIKKEISELEQTLKSKNRELDSIEKLGEQYTKGGYARKVAEMQSIRTVRKAAGADMKKVGLANVLQKFLPVVDQLEVLTAQYENDEFAKKYSALASDFNGALKKMEVAEFVVEDGSKADLIRVEAVSEEHSDSVEKGNIIQALEKGYELDGNIMRMAKAVVSLGPEAADDTEADESAESEGEGDSEE